MADEVTVPTKEEIAQLPRWAKVAFAARCARRVLPLFKLRWPKASSDQEKAVRRAVELAEKSAATTAVVAAAAYAANAAGAAAANSVAIAAANAAGAAADDDDGVSFVAAAARAANAAAQLKIVELAFPNIRQDFQHILDASRQGNWTDDTPVPPWVFGPMWPNGVPEGWPEADPNGRLQVTVGVPEGAPPEQTAEYLNRLHGLLNKLNIQNGGAGITIDTVRREEPKEAPVPVGGGS